MMATLVFAAKKYQSLIPTLSCSQDQRRQDAASGQSAKMSWGPLWSWAILSSQTRHQVCLNFTPVAAAEVDLFSASMSVPEWSSLEKTAWSPWKLPGNWQNSRTVVAETPFHFLLNHSTHHHCSSIHFISLCFLGWKQTRDLIIFVSLYSALFNIIFTQHPPK